MATEVIIKNTVDFTVSNGSGKYSAFKNSWIAFVFKSFDGLLSVNGVSVSNITSSSDSIAYMSSPHRIYWETMGASWNVNTTQNSPFLAKYIYNSETYIVVFGKIGTNGVPTATANTCCSDIVLNVDDAKVPTYLYGCRLEGKPIRSDCNGVVTMYNLGGSLAAGQIPL